MSGICRGSRAQALISALAVKLLLDQNLSSRLLSAIGDLYPGSIHVRDVKLQSATDEVVWKYAHQHGLMIVSKDVDFHQRSLVFGAPPKVIWIALGNCSTDEIADLLRNRHPDIAAFEQNPQAAFLLLL